MNPGTARVPTSTGPKDLLAPGCCAVLADLISVGLAATLPLLLAFGGTRCFVASAAAARPRNRRAITAAKTRTVLSARFRPTRRGEQATTVCCFISRAPLAKHPRHARDRRNARHRQPVPAQRSVILRQVPLPRRRPHRARLRLPSTRARPIYRRASHSRTARRCGS